MSEDGAHRRDLLLAPLLAGLPALIAGGSIGGAGLIRAAQASPLDPAQTMITLPDQIAWKQRPDWPHDCNAQAPLFSDTTQPGLYYVLVKWFPGYMSAPHTYVSDRLCVVVSGTWWVNSGPDFDPARCVPVPAGTFIRRVAHTPHYDGVVAGGAEPAVIAICGIGPVGLKWLEADKPGWRKV